MNNHDIKVMNSLVATTIDSADGYRDAAERTSDDRLKPVFDRFERERRHTAERLKDEVRQFGGAPQEDGTIKAAAHRRWLDLKDTLGRGDRAVLDSVEAGERYICGKYETALKDQKLSAGARNAISQAFTSIKNGKTQVSELRRRCGLPETTNDAGGNWNAVGLGIGALAALAGVAVAVSKGRRASERSREDEAFRFKLETDENMRMISSSKIEGTPVFGRDGARIGKIDSFMVDKYSGRVGYAVMTFGGTMGFGESLFPLPWSVLSYDEQCSGYLVNLTKEELRDAPRFEAKDEPEFDPEYRRRVLVFYRADLPTGRVGQRDQNSTSDEGDAVRSESNAAGNEGASRDRVSRAEPVNA